MHKQCDFCSKAIGFFRRQSEEAVKDGLCLCNNCYNTLWRNQANPTIQAKQLAKVALNNHLKPEIKKIVVTHVKQLVGQDQKREDGNASVSPELSESIDADEREKKESLSYRTEVVENQNSVQVCDEEKEIKSNKQKQTVPTKGTAFLCGETVTIGGLEIDNPCVYVSDEGFSFAINSKAIPSTITKSEETDRIAEITLDQKDLIYFDATEISYFLLWLSGYKDYVDLPPHCFSRFFDGIFHRALIEKQDQLQIINKVLDIVGTNQSMVLNVRFLRFVFAVLNDIGKRISRTEKIEICRRLKNLFNFNFYFLKPGWDWDPISWYLETDMKEYIPNVLLEYQKLAAGGVKAARRGVILAKAYAECISIIKGKKTQMGSPCITNSYTERYVKNYHDEVFTYKTLNWYYSGGEDEPGDQFLFDAMDDYIFSDWHHAELIDSNGENSLIELWLAMPPEYQQDIAELFRADILPFVGRELSIRSLFEIFDKTYPSETKNIWAIGDYYLKYIQRCIGYLGYSLVITIPVEKVKLETPVWIVETSKSDEKKRELMEDASKEALFVVNEKGRITGISSQAYTLDVVHIPSEIDGRLIKEIGPDVFSDSIAMKHLIIDEGIKVIRSNAFCNCKNLETIELPDSLTEIVGGSFVGCSSIKQVTIPKNVKKIGSNAFSGCESLKKIQFNGNVSSLGNSLFLGSALQEIDLPQTMKTIPYCFFYSCKKLESITIKHNIVSIEGSAFTDCEKLKSVTIENDNCVIRDRAFENCSSLSDFPLPSMIEDIPSSSFSYCKNLHRLEIPANVRHIGSWAFSDCTSLQKVVFHNEDCVFDDYSFASCLSLSEVALPRNSHGEISKVFSGCENLKSILAPRSMVIGDDISFSINPVVEVQFYD